MAHETEDREFDEIVLVFSEREGFDVVAIPSIGKAADMLVNDWPTTRRTMKHAEALRACAAALQGSISPEEARKAFEEALKEADVFFDENVQYE